MGRAKKNASSQAKDNVSNTVRKSPRKRPSQSHSPTSIDKPKRGRPKKTLPESKTGMLDLEGDLDDGDVVKSEKARKAEPDEDDDLINPNQGHRALTLASRNTDSSKGTTVGDGYNANAQNFEERRAWGNPSNGQPTIKEADIIAITSSEKLVDIINKLIGTKDVAFQRYKALSQQKLASLEREVSYLQDELVTKQNTIDAISSHLSTLPGGAGGSTNDLMTPKRGTNTMYESPIRNSKTQSAMISPADMEDELKTISFTFDMLELLTGARVIHYEEDEEKYYFDVRQTDTSREMDGTAISIEYRLVIRRKVEQTAEVTYIPLFLENMDKEPADEEQRLKNEHAALVKTNLPTYLCENLRFPFNTLLQFSAKIVKALNKSGRSR